MMNKEAKKNYVEEMKKNFTSNESVMIAQYQGLNVTELDQLRKELREKGIIFKITKNRITKIAIKETPVKDLEKYFTGPTATAISSDPISAAKILTKFAKSHDKLKIVAGFSTLARNPRSCSHFAGGNYSLNSNLDMLVTVILHVSKNVSYLQIKRLQYWAKTPIISNF